MQHWSPDEAETAAPAPAPSDAWVVWLSRMPDRTPEPPVRLAPSLSGILLVGGMVGFWSGAVALLWWAIG